MSWLNVPRPDGVSNIQETATGVTARVSVPIGEDGYLGRQCPACQASFKMRHDEYEALPDDLELTCPYCGHHEEHNLFMSAAQRDRLTAAVEGLAEQWVHSELNDVLARTFGRHRSRGRRPGFLSVDVRVTPSRPPTVRELPAALEEQTRRVIECSRCDNHHAVYSATAFCPVCGPRPATETVLEAIESALQALAVEDRVGEDERETFRAFGVFERFAVDGIESVVSLFEMFARDQFTRRVQQADEHVRGRGNVFQRPEDAAVLFARHANLNLVELVGQERWQRLGRAFAQRHILSHNGGIVDDKFIARVPDSALRPGQRLVVRRVDAEQALNDLAVVVRTVGAAE